MASHMLAPSCWFKTSDTGRVGDSGHRGVGGGLRLGQRGNRGGARLIGGGGTKHYGAGAMAMARNGTQWRVTATATATAAVQRYNGAAVQRCSGAAATPPRWPFSSRACCRLNPPARHVFKVRYRMACVQAFLRFLCHAHVTGRECGKAKGNVENTQSIWCLFTRCRGGTGSSSYARIERRGWKASRRGVTPGLRTANQQDRQLRALSRSGERAWVGGRVRGRVHTHTHTLSHTHTHTHTCSLSLSLSLSFTTTRLVAHKHA